MGNKIFGYFLIGTGLICMLFSFYSLYSVFTDAASPPEIFRLSSFNFSIAAPGSGGAMEVKVPLDPQIIKIVNVFLSYIFMVFVVTVGSKLSSLGIQLTRDK